MLQLIKKLYIRSCGYSYTNLGRLFLRLFVGIMLIQFGVRQIADFDSFSQLFPAIWGMSPETSLVVLIAVEMICSVFIMFGFLTRVMTIPPFVAMIVAEYQLLPHRMAYMTDWQSQAFLPVMFMGIYFFILLVGPGKISIDYFLSLHFIHTANHDEAEELEEV